MKLLIIEDERELSDSISHYFGEEEFLCDTAYDYHSAMQKVRTNEYVCILLDITLPGGSGLNILRELKKAGKAEGVIVISARNSMDDKIEGLQTGADDYLAKPFHLAELGARVNSVIRRRSFGGQNEIRLNGLVLDIFTKTLKRGAEDITLTKKEYELLLYFLGNKNRVVTKEAIVEHLWGDYIEMADSYDFIYAHIKNLRRKLIQAGCPDYIKVVYGLGYKFTLP